MIPILYDSNETAFVSNGLGRLRDMISCEVIEERNSVYECNFDYPVTGAHFDEILCGRIIAVRHDESNDIQPFDIVSYSAPIDGVVSFHAEHISYRQSRIVTKAQNITTLAGAFDALTAPGATYPANPFTYETDKTGASGFVAAFNGLPISVKSVLGGVDGSILDTFHGEYEWDKFRVILHANRGELRDFYIRYGVNMLEFNDETDYSETYSAIVPYWNNGEMVVGNPVTRGEQTYTGREDCVAMDLTDKFETKPSATDLENEALKILDGNTVLPKQNIKIDFVRVHEFSGYEELENLTQCNLCDSVKVVFPRYNMQGTYKIVRVVWDVLKDRYAEMELGDLQTSLAESLGISNSVANNSVTPVDYVIEEGGTGTQDNWHYIKFANGIAACWRRWNQSGIAINQTAGQLKYAALGAIDDYPITFYYNPVVLFSGSVSNGNGWVSNNRTNQTTTNCGGFFAYSYANQNSAVVTVNIMVVGRWKAS